MESKSNVCPVVAFPCPMPGQPHPLQCDAQITQEEFPTSMSLRQFFYKNDMNDILTMVKNRMIQSKRQHQQSARIVIADVNHYPVQLMTEAKEFLKMRGYSIVDIEDAAGNASGFKISWV